MRCRLSPTADVPSHTSGAAMCRYVAKVFLGWRTKNLRAADTFCARRREGPYRLIQNRSRTSVVALKSDATADKSKDQFWRYFPRRSIFDFCNNIPPQCTARRPSRIGKPLKSPVSRFKQMPVDPTWFLPAVISDSDTQSRSSYPRKNCRSTWLTSSGCSCCTQCPAPSTRLVLRQRVHATVCILSKAPGFW